MTSGQQNPASEQLVIERLPLLRDHAGSPPDLILRWNRTVAAAQDIDLVLHLHGYADAGPGMDLQADKLPISGLDFGDPDLPVGSTVGHLRPTLCILPRGHYFGGRTGRGYDFHALIEPGACSELVQFACETLGRHLGGTALPIARRILTAHSGGGAAVEALIPSFHPHEIHLFDALYSSAPTLAKWAASAIASDRSLLRQPSAEPLGRHAMRVFFIPETGTAAASLELHKAITATLLPSDGPLSSRFRVEPTSIDHNAMPRRLGWQLLADASAEIKTLE